MTSNTKQVEREFAAQLFRTSSMAGESPRMTVVRAAFVDLYRTILANLPEGPATMIAATMIGDRLTEIACDFARDFS